MKAIAEDSQLLLPLLGMLLEQPRSVRELTRQLGQGARFEHLSPDSGTIHALMLLLSEAGWITSVTATGVDPLDQICTITPAGREELKRRLGEALINTSWTAGHQFVAALPHLHLFDRDEAVALLDQRATGLRRRSREFQALANARQRTFTETAKDDYLLARTQTEIGWIESYRDRLTSTPWPPVDILEPESAL
jgi:DNA-binding PadR family transcriptional regulator